MTGARVGLGAAGEAHVRRHLERLGWRFVEANWRCKLGEIDLVFEDGPELVLVEVKTRRGDGSGAAVEAISRSKASNLLRTAEWYVASHPRYADAVWRIDVAALQLSPTGEVLDLSIVDNAVLGR